MTHSGEQSRSREAIYNAVSDFKITVLSTMQPCILSTYFYRSKTVLGRSSAFSCSPWLEGGGGVGREMTGREALKVLLQAGDRDPFPKSLL